jgi:hypothetical protein
VNWKSETEKPPAYETVLLALGDDFTTGYWAEKAQRWIGFAFDRSPPIYRLANGSVIFWSNIERRTESNDDH